MKNDRLTYVKLDILENWRFWHRFAKDGLYEEAGREVIAQANALLDQDMESNPRAAEMIAEGLEFKRKRTKAGHAGGIASGESRARARMESETSRPEPQKAQRQKAASRKKSGIFDCMDGVVDFARAHGLDVDDAVECWNATIERGGRDAEGDEITNFPGFLTQWCRTRAENRNSEGKPDEDPPF